MNRFKTILSNVTSNIAEYYTLFVIVIVIPTIVGSLTQFIFGCLLSFVIQAIIGVLYIRDDN